MAFFTQLLNLAAGVQHGGMVATAKRIADFRQAVVGQLFGQRHRHLARTRHRTGAAFGQQVRYLNLVVLRHRLLNIVDGDQFFLQRQQIAQRFAHEIDGDRPVN